MSIDSSDLNRETTTLLSDIEEFMRDLVELMLYKHLTVPLFIQIGPDQFWHSGHTEETREVKKFLATWTTQNEQETQYYHFRLPLQVIASLGYLSYREVPATSHSPSMYRYSPTEKAWALLERPRQTPKIFISYKRGISSALALAIQFRLQMLGANPESIFIDKDILGGEDWEAHIKQKAEECEFFICLIGKTWDVNDNKQITSLDSPYVQKEINWAFERDKAPRIIPIYHNGYSARECEEDYPELSAKLNANNARVLTDEKAADYEEAINFILRSLGYQTS